MANEYIIPYEFNQNLAHEDNTIQSIEIIDGEAIVSEAKVIRDENGINSSYMTSINYQLVKNQNTKAWSISEIQTDWTLYGDIDSIGLWLIANEELVMRTNIWD